MYHRPRRRHAARARLAAYGLHLALAMCAVGSTGRSIRPTPVAGGIV